MIKHLFSDIDGTLLNDNSEISKYTKEVINRCNIPFTLVSGRSPQKMEIILNELGIGGIHVAYNGAMVFKRESNKFIILQKHLLNRDFAKKLVIDIREKFSKVGISLYDEENWNVDIVNKDIKHEKSVVNTNYVLVDFEQYFKDSINDIYKVSFIEHDTKMFSKLSAYIEQNYGREKICIQKSLSGYLEITHIKAKKSSGIEFIMRLENLGKENVVVFGDGENDISMLQSAGYSIVMDNASEKVKKYADYITKSNNEDGVAYVVEGIIAKQKLE